MANKAERKTSEKQLTYSKRYDEKFDSVRCRLPKGAKKIIAETGYTSVNAFIIDAVTDYLIKLRENSMTLTGIPKGTTIQAVPNILTPGTKSHKIKDYKTI